MTQTHDIEWYWAQVRRIEEHREKDAEKEIRKLYKEMLKDLQSFVGNQYAMYAENDQLTYAILQAKGEEARFLEEVEANINSVTPKIRKEIKSVVEQTYTAAYEGMVDAVEKAHNLEELRINLEGIRGTTPEVVEKAVENPISGLTLSDTLEKHRKDVIYEIKRQIGVGLIAGDRYSTMARRISDQLDMDYRKSVRIVRTETHRVREAGAQEGAEAVQEKLKAADSEYRLVKIWRTMKDERVRPQRKAYKRKAGVKARKQYTAGLRSSLNGPNHMKMEGQTVLVDELFDLGDGVKAMVPGSSGVAGHDINCRCYTREKLMNDDEFFKATGRHFKNVLTTDSKDDMSKLNDKSALSTYFNKHEDIYKRTKKVKKLDDYEDVFIHGDSTGFEIYDTDGNLSARYTVREFADVLRKDPNYHGGDIRLCSCGTGAEDAIAAKALARQLGVNVLAPSDTLWIDVDGVMTIGPDEFTDSGKWILFNGRE